MHYFIRKARPKTWQEINTTTHLPKKTLTAHAPLFCRSSRRSSRLRRVWRSSPWVRWTTWRTTGTASTSSSSYSALSSSDCPASKACPSYALSDWYVLFCYDVTGHGAWRQQRKCDVNGDTCKITIYNLAICFNRSY